MAERDNGREKIEDFWNLVETKDILEIIHKDGKNKAFTAQQEYTRDPKYSSTLEVNLMPDDKELKITPHKIRHYAMDVNIPDGEATITLLSAGTTDGKSIAWLGFTTRSKEGNERIQQYFFTPNGKPASFRSNGLESPVWPSNRTPIPDEIAGRFDSLSLVLGSETTLSLFDAVDILSRKPFNI